MNVIKRKILDNEISHSHKSFEFILREYNRMVLFVVPFVLVLALLAVIEPKILPISIILSVLMVGILIVLNDRLETRRVLELISRLNKIDYYDHCPKCSILKADGSINRPTKESD